MSPKKTSMLGSFQRNAIIWGVILLTALFLFFISPFFAILIVAGVIATDVYTFNNWLAKKVRYRTIASLITTLLILAVIITPLTIFLTFVIGESVTVLQSIYENWSLANFALGSLVPEFIASTGWGADFVRYLNSFVIDGTAIQELFQQSISSLTSIGSELFTQTTNVLRGISIAAIYIIMFILSLYFFLLDGHKVVQKTTKLLPLPTKYKGELITKLCQLSKGITYGIFGAAIVQGFFGGIGIAIAGIDNAILWGTLMALFSPIPYLGPAVIWVPISLYTLAQGDWVAGTFIFIWGGLVVSTVDNIVKPYLIGKSASINPLLVMLTLLGGILVFGLEAIVYGPFLLTLLFSLLHIYELEYADDLKQ